MFTFLENQTCLTIKAARTDNGSDYVNKDLTSYFESKGIDHHTTMPYTPEQSGKAERLDCTLLDNTRSVLAESGLVRSVRGEAINTANTLCNLSPTVNKDKTPRELLFQFKSGLSKFACLW
eukprot:GHRR01013814.1.p1 GENE.GHRR01013814.1~~GHRR01013814.1.p1  ORF type:complete len:121 (+),score=18.87 GHRR01013814.1:1085-1447(+)